MSKLLLSLAFAICITLPAEAAFRFHNARAASCAPSRNHFDANSIISGRAQVVSPQDFSKPIANPDDRYSITAEGVFSLACAAFCVVSLIALSITSFSFFVIPAIIFGAGAIVFGAIGLHRTRKANAIVGMVIGFLGTVAALIVLAGL